jgi:SAM-dependent methyltransferase
MGVAAHLGIRLGEYDARIRTFIPDYEEMLGVAAAALSPRARTIVDLGTGTGALAARCLARAAGARLVGIDIDPEILDVAARRLGRRASLVAGSLTRVPLPPCDAVVASFALHHVRTRPAKARLYARIARALRPRGQLYIVDCHPAADRAIAAEQRAAWRAHLERAYTARRSEAFLRAWGREDVYVPLETEVELMRGGRWRPEILWRKGAFAVLAARQA